MYSLLPSQKNMVYDAIKIAGFIPGRVEMTMNSLGFTLHLGSIGESKFCIDAHVDSHACLLYLGSTTHQIAHAENFNGLITNIKKFAKIAQAELSTPDLWKDGERYKEYIETVPLEQRPNTLFSEVEQNWIRQEFSKLANEISEKNGLNASQINLLDQKVDYLVEAADRLGRFDWVGLVTGWLFSYVFEAAVDPVAATEAVIKFSQTAYELAYPVLKQIS